jgi:hypothetical protein
MREEKRKKQSKNVIDKGMFRNLGPLLNELQREVLDGM